MEWIRELALLGFLIFGIGYGIAFAFLGGFIAGRVGGRRDLARGIVLSTMIALGAVASIIARAGASALWTQISALVLLAPASLIGDSVSLGRDRDRE